MKRAFTSFIACSLLTLVVTAYFGERDQRLIAFTNVNLVPMTDEKIFKNQTVLGKEKIIVKTGPSRGVKISKKRSLLMEKMVTS